MIVIPAIDLKDGQCVRLYQGDYGKVTVYDDDPLAVALRWQSAGARLLHLVDLDGARAGTPQNLEAIRAIATTLTIPVELGGGIRDEGTLSLVLALGVARVVLGTAALDDPSFLERACQQWGDRIVAGIDARDGWVATRGWREMSGISALTLARQVAMIGCRRLIYTDIARDGTLTQPNYAELAKLTAAVPIPVIASGGVASLDHLKRLTALRVEGAIVGKALYTGDVDLAAAIAAVQPTEAPADAH